VERGAHGGAGRSLGVDPAPNRASVQYVADRVGAAVPWG
jgi:hypothetical protein